MLSLALSLSLCLSPSSTAPSPPLSLTLSLSLSALSLHPSISLRLSASLIIAECSGRSKSHVMLSDDMGATWRLGATLGGDLLVQSDQCQAVLLANGSVLIDPGALLLSRCLPLGPRIEEAVAKRRLNKELSEERGRRQSVAVETLSLSLSFSLV